MKWHYKDKHDVDHKTKGNLNIGYIQVTHKCLWDGANGRSDLGTSHWIDAAPKQSIKKLECVILVIRSLSILFN